MRAVSEDPAGLTATPEGRGAALAASGDYRLLVTPDHPTFLRTKTHSHGLVPWTICGTSVTPDRFTSYDELSGDASSLVFDPGHGLMEFFLKGNAG